MDMTRREVNFYLKQMSAHGYIAREKGTHTESRKSEKSEISLTEFGKITGEEFQYRHEILTQFLQSVGVSDEKAEEDACRMEHKKKKDSDKSTDKSQKNNDKATDEDNDKTTDKKQED